MNTAVVIPARDEAGSLPRLLGEIAQEMAEAHVIVVDNGSHDATADVARAGGATVIAEARAGYGYACHAGVERALRDGADVVVFMDADGSMPVADIACLVAPIQADTADLVCGARRVDRSLMPWHQRFGNRVIAAMLRILWGVRLRELGPFRAVRATSLAGLDLPGSRFAWPAQMLARASRADLRIAEIPVGYAARTAGHSKVGGSVKGSLRASWDISRTLVTERWHR